MPYVLILRLSGPLMSSGAADCYDTRRTRLYPSKGMVVGLIANALGKDRSDDISDIASLRYAVRTDQRPGISTDYQTVHTADAQYVTPREYLTNASFLCGLEGDDEQWKFLLNLLHAVRHPQRPLYGGRKCCPLDLPIGLSVKKGALETVMETYAVSSCGDTAGEFFRCECREGEYPDEVSLEQPLSFDTMDRRFGELPIKFLPCMSERKEKS